MKIKNILILGIFTLQTVNLEATDNKISDNLVVTKHPNLCHVKNIKKIQLKPSNNNVMGNCQEGDVLSIYMGGVNHRPEWFIATVARLCATGTISISIATNQNVATCTYRGKILDIRE